MEIENFNDMVSGLKKAAQENNLEKNIYFNNLLRKAEMECRIENCTYSDYPKSKKSFKSVILYPFLKIINKIKLH